MLTSDITIMNYLVHSVFILNFKLILPFIQLRVFYDVKKINYLW